MILLFNVKITSRGLSYYHRSQWLPVFDRLDIFKYCLASYSALLPVLSKVILYIQVEQEFAHKQQELEQWINELFPADKLELNWYRNNLTQDWRTLCEQQNFADDDLIWFAGNDDHIFIDSSLDVVNAGIKLLNDDPNPLSAIYYSHWPEQMRLSIHHQGELTPDGNYIKFNWRTFDAIRIIKGARFKRYWADTDFGDQLVYRTDHLYHAGYELTGPVYAPTKELVRHYDGYSHVSDQLINILPPLVIPPGFFEKNIKLRVGYLPRDNTAVNLYPPAQWLYSANPTGTDYRWVEQDIPLFWKDKITSVDKDPDYDQQQMNQARDAAFIAGTCVPMHCYQIQFTHENAAPPEWFRNHMIYGKN
jgi:hypothetical protein